MNKTVASLLFVLVSSSSWAGTITIGQTSVLTSPDWGNANQLLAQSPTLPQTATIQRMSFYVTAAAGELVLAIYDSSGSGSGPGQLLASTGAFTPIVGWNTQPVTSPVALAPGTYWLSYFPSDNGLSFVITNTGQWYEDSMTFSGSMPRAFVSTHGDVGNWSLYATFFSEGNPLPSLTPTPPPGTGKPGLKLFGGVQDFNLSPPLQINYTAPDPLWKPISQGPAIGNQFPSNWWRDGQTIGILWAGNASLATLAARCQTAANWCAANGANGPCLQLTYPGHMPGSWADDPIPNFTNYLDALAPYISAGTYEIAINEILANNGAIQNNDPLLIALGGTGATGWDALIALVKLERQHMPQALLGINDFSVCDWSNGHTAGFFNAQSCINAYKACHDNGAPMDWLGIEGYWYNSEGYYMQNGFQGFIDQFDYIGAAVLPYLTGACGTAFMGVTEFTPDPGEYGGKGLALYPNQQAAWTAMLTAFANDKYIFGVTGPWESFRLSGAFTTGTWFYNDTGQTNVPNYPDSVTSTIQPSLGWLQNWVATNVHP